MLDHRVLDRATPRGTRPPVPNPVPNASTDQEYSLATLLGQTVVTTPAVTESTVRGLPAAGYCSDLIANACAAMMVDAQVFSGDDTELDRPPIVDCPNVLIDEFDFWWQVFDALIKHGNYVALPADFDENGYPRQAVPIPRAAVHVDDSAGLPVYDITGLGRFAHDEVIHIARRRPVGSSWGLGVVEQYRRQWQTLLHQQSYQLNSHATGAIPSAVVTLDVNKVEGEVALQVQNDWIEAHGAGNRKPAVVPRTMKIEPLSWSPEDAQFLESRQLSIGETAYMFGLHPADIGAVIATGGSTMTYENLSTRQLARLIDSYNPYLARVERSWSRLTPGAVKVRGNPDALQRMSTRERYELRQLAQAIGIETSAESRVLERRPPAPEPPSPPPAPPAPDTDPVLDPPEVQP